MKQIIFYPSQLALSLIGTVLLSCLLCALPTGLWASTPDTGKVTSMSLYLKKTPGSNGQALYEVAQGTRL